MRTSALLITLTALAAPATAGAATIATEATGHAGVQRVRYVAAPGEANRLTIVHDGNLFQERVILADAGATMTVSGLCTAAADGRAAACVIPSSVGRFADVRVDLGDGDDTMREASGYRGIALVVLAGPGDDVLKGGAGDDRLDGGGGTDTIRGRDGDDTVTDGDTDATADADILDGGPASKGAGPDGDNTIVYAGRRRDLDVDLHTASTVGGAKGERDRISHFKSAVGGAGDDVIRGPSRRRGRIGSNSILRGGAGDDDLRDGMTMRGGAGRDVIRGAGEGEFRARLFGGPGRDELFGSNGPEDFTGGGGFDRYACRGGKDYVQQPGARERIPRACSELEFVFSSFPSPSFSTYFYLHVAGELVGRRTVRHGVDCADSLAPIAPYAATLTLRQRAGRHRLVGRARFRCPGTYVVRVRLTKRGGRLARRKHGVAVLVHVKNEGVPDLRWGYRLK